MSAPVDRPALQRLLRSYAAEGRTIIDAARLLRRRPNTLREYARTWGIAFTDYNPRGQA